MDTVNLEANSNESFSFMHSISAWSQLYDLEKCDFKIQAREAPGNPLPIYEWSDQSNNLTIFVTKAKGWFKFAGQPSPNDTITIGDETIKFVSSSASGKEVNIGTDLGTTLASLMTWCSTHTTLSSISVIDFSLIGSEIDMTYKIVGGIGNSLPISKSGSNISVSGEHLSGGTAILQMSAPRQNVQRFKGTFYYDAKLYFQGDEIDMFGGSIKFIQGVTI